MAPEDNTPSQATAGREMTLDEFAKSIRSELKDIGFRMLMLKNRMLERGFGETGASVSKELQSEAIANAVLAFRHAEDSAMRLGKILQALNGGESVYDNSGVLPQK